MSRQYTLNRTAAPSLHIDYAALLNPQQHQAVTAARDSGDSEPGAEPGGAGGACARRLRGTAAG